MKLTDEVYIVAAGDHGIRMTSSSDCAVFLINGGDHELALIDAGVGADTPAIIRNIEADGFNPKDIKVLYLTHSHTDHIGGAKDFRDLLGCKVAISEEEAPLSRTRTKRSWACVWRKMPVTIREITRCARARSTFVFRITRN